MYKYRPEHIWLIDSQQRNQGDLWKKDNLSTNGDETTVYPHGGREWGESQLLNSLKMDFIYLNVRAETKTFLEKEI